MTSGSDCFYCERRGTGLMICCERCLVWFHFKCVHKKWDLHLKRKQLHLLSDYYCYPCRRLNPALKLKYYSSDNINLLPVDMNNKTTRNGDQKLTLNLKKPGLKSETTTRQDVTPYSPSSSTTSSTTTTSHSPSSPSSSSSCYSKSPNSPGYQSTSSSPDEAIENKQPNRLLNQVHSSTTTKSHESTKEECQQQHHNHKKQQHSGDRHRQQQQQQQEPQQKIPIRKNGGIRKLSGGSKKAFKNGKQSKLRNKLRKAMRRHGHSGNFL